MSKIRYISAHYANIFTFLKLFPQSLGPSAMNPRIYGIPGFPGISEIGTGIWDFSSKSRFWDRDLGLTFRIWDLCFIFLAYPEKARKSQIDDPNPAWYARGKSVQI